jgi:hypothetical protein
MGRRLLLTPEQYIEVEEEEKEEEGEEESSWK